MRLCNKTITVYNAKCDPDTGYDVYFGTVISGVSWFGELAASVDKTGMNAANKYTIRIPTDARIEGNKSYTDPIMYAASDPNQFFTLSRGSIVVLGQSDLKNPRPADLFKRFNEVFTILGVTDSRGIVNAPHWKVVGA